MPPLPTPHQAMLSQMLRMVAVFASRVDDRSTLDELYRMIGDESSWSNAHDLFDRIRSKTLVANRTDAPDSPQYYFEEACAKTLYNLTDTVMPFDYDAPYWVVPTALSLARQLGIDETEIARIVAD